MLSRTLALTALMGAAACSSGLMAMEYGNVDIHGFVSMGFLKSSDNNYLGQSEDGTFQFNEFGINFRTELDENTSAGIQFFSRDLGELGNNEILVDWAFLDHKINDRFGVRIGRVKLPGAMYNEYQDIDAVRGTVLMPQGPYNLNFRDTLVGVDGIAFYGNLNTGGIGDFDYNVYYGVLPIKDNGSVARAFEYVGGNKAINFESDLKAAWGGNLTWNTPLDGFRVALSYQQLDDWTINNDIVTEVPVGGGSYTKVFTPLTLHSDHFNIATLSIEYAINQWVLSSEFQKYHGNFETSQGDSPVEWQSWYLQASYEFNEQWMVTGYYMNYVSDPDDHDSSTEYQRDVTLAVRYNVNESWNIKAEIHSINGTSLLSASDNPNGPSDDNWTLFALKSTVSF